MEPLIKDPPRKGKTSCYSGPLPYSFNHWEKDSLLTEDEWPVYFSEVPLYPGWLTSCWVSRGSLVPVCWFSGCTYYVRGTWMPEVVKYGISNLTLMGGLPSLSSTKIKHTRMHHSDLRWSSSRAWKYLTTGGHRTKLMKWTIKSLFQTWQWQNIPIKAQPLHTYSIHYIVLGVIGNKVCPCFKGQRLSMQTYLILHLANRNEREEETPYHPTLKRHTYVINSG